MNRNLIIGLIIGLLVIAGIGYFLSHKQIAQSSLAPRNEKLQISASFYPMYFFASQIAGEKADIKNITPAGGEPHDYEPTPQDIASIENGKLLILNGGGLEAWGDKIKETLKGKNVSILVAGENLANQQVEENGKNIQDPHVWLSPPLAKKMVNKITQAIVNIDPQNTTYYQGNEKALDQKLDKLDNEYKQGLGNCKNKDIIISHAAFGYLSTTYGLHQVPIAGLSPDSEPSPKQLADIAKFAKDNNIKYIFFESLVSPKLSQTIASEIGAKTLVLNPIEGLTDDEIKSGASYTTVMEDNLSNLKTALECT